MNIPRDEMLGKTDAEVFPEESASELRRNDRLVAETGQVLRIEELVGTPAGPVPFLSVKYPLYDSNGELFATAGIAIDIQEQKRLEESIREQVRQRDQFLAMLSHELRNPLAAVVSASEQIDDDDPEGRAAASEVIRRQTANMKRMLDDLLDVARVTQNRLPVHREPIDLLETSRHAVECIRDRALQNEITLHVDVPTHPIPVDGDSVRLQQAQVNLLSNAIRFTPPGGEIRFQVEQDGDTVRISVQDSGSGLEPDQLDHIFETFYQSEQRSNRPLGGLGIGLPLTRYIVEAHAGSVTAQSGGTNCGSTFLITLPTADADVGATPKAEPPVVETNLKIMLIEDNDDLRRMLSRSLELRGFHVKAVPDGASGLKAVSEYSPDILLVDIGLPDMDGYEVARRIRQQSGSRKMLLVALTGYGSDEDRAEVARAGFQLHLVKPLDAGAIAARTMDAWQSLQD